MLYLKHCIFELKLQTIESIRKFSFQKQNIPFKLKQQLAVFTNMIST